MAFFAFAPGAPTDKPERRRALLARLLPPLGDFFDDNSAGGINAARAALATTYRNFIGQRLELVDVDRRTAFLAGDCTTLVKSFWTCARTCAEERCHGMGSG